MCRVDGPAIEQQCARGTKLAPPPETGWMQWVLAAMPLAVMRLLQRANRCPNNKYLEGVFAPIDKEIASEDLIVEGAVPHDLQGLYVRTGPNPQNAPEGGYHWFDGEAMVHAVYFTGGAAKTYNNHWLRCNRFLREQAAKRNIDLRFGDMTGVRGLVLMMWNNAFGWLWAPRGSDKLANSQLGNTALVFHDSKLLGLMEGGYPFLIRACRGLVRSIGAYTFGGALEHSVTAHPKVDAGTGELVSFTYNVSPSKASPHLVQYFTVSPQGEKSLSIPVDVEKGQMMHDFAITQHYAIFMDHALIFDGATMVKSGGLPFKCDTSKPSRLGLLRRDAPLQPVRWFAVPAFVCFHTAAAWEEGATVHLVICKYDYIDLNGGITGDFNESTAREAAEPCRYSIDTETGKVSVTRLVPDKYCDFPVVAPELVGRSAAPRYAFCGVMPGAHDVGMRSLIKIDLHAGTDEGLVGEITHPAGCVGGEFALVARDSAALSAGTALEDEAYLVGYVTNEDTKQSYCMIYDAQTMSSQPVAAVVMPQRVPLGFHGLWITQKQLDSQT